MLNILIPPFCKLCDTCKKNPKKTRSIKMLYFFLTFIKIIIVIINFFLKNTVKMNIYRK